MPDDMTWRLVEPGEETSFTFDGRGRGRQNNSQEVKINQLVVRMDGWQGTTKAHHSLESIILILNLVSFKEHSRIS